MTINSIHADLDGTQLATCVWFDKTTKIVQSFQFNINALELNVSNNKE